MLKIDLYEDEIRKHDGCYYHCASIDTSYFHGYTMLDAIETREASYEDAKEKLLKYVIELRDELNNFIERETR